MVDNHDPFLYRRIRIHRQTILPSNPPPSLDIDDRFVMAQKNKEATRVEEREGITTTSRNDLSITKIDKDKPATDSQDAVETDQPHEEACAVPRFVECLVEAFVRIAQVLLMQMIIVSKLSSTNSNHCNVVAYSVIENAPLARIFVTLSLCDMDRQRLRVYQSGQCEKILCVSSSPLHISSSALNTTPKVKSPGE